MSEVYYQSGPYAPPQRPKLEGKHTTDACVIGAGFAGLNAALGLLESGVENVTLLDAQHPGFGASGRNGGFAFGGYSLGESELIDAVGPERARELYQLTLDGVDLIRDRIESWGIDCQYAPQGVLWANWFGDDELLRTKQRLMAEKFGVEWEWLNEDQVAGGVKTDRYTKGLLERNAFHFQPFLYAKALAARIEEMGGKIFHQSPAIGMDRSHSPPRLTTPEGQVEAEHFLFCGGGYTQDVVPELRSSIMPIATYVMTTAPLGDRMEALMPANWAVYDTRFAFDYFRPLPDTRLLWGGRIESFGADESTIERKLRRDMERVFPELEGVAVDHVWQGFMGYSRHQMPQIGQLEPGIWYAQGFGGHGVSTSNIGGTLLARAVADGDNTYKWFEPFGLAPVYGYLGRMAAQGTYWWLQSKDWLKERIC